MNILFLTPQIPYPPHSGGRIVTWNTIRRFAQSATVHVVSLYHHPSERSYLKAMQKICATAEAFPAHGKWSLWPMLHSCCSTWPFKALRFYNPAMKAYVRQLLDEHPIDVIHAQNFYTTTYADGDEPCLKIHYKENMEGNLLIRYSQAHPNLAVQMLAYFEGLRTRRFEMRACHKFDRVLAISPLDRDALLERNPSLSIEHQPAGVDLDAYPFLPEPSGPPTLVFTGTMSYYPNADGVRTFLEQAWMKIRTRVQDARLMIVGSDPPPSIQKWDGADGVTVTGRVPSVHDYLKQATLYLVPLRVGGGIRLKILEAMASGRAIVSTPVGCEGLQVTDGEHLRIAGLGDNFAAAVIQLLEKPDLRNQLREKARAQVEALYNWDAIVAEQVARYQQWLMERPPHPRV